MALIEGWLPPTRENWELLSKAWQLFPLFASAQWLFPNWYPAGKTSVTSRLNIPGKIAWLTMEAPGVLTLLYIMNTLPHANNLTTPLPWANWTMAGMFTIHYIYRAFLFPFLNPSMSPIHIFVWCSAVVFQLCNAICIGGWLAGFGPTSALDWADGVYRMYPGLILFGWGLIGNMYHDDDLREIRRAAARRQKREAEKLRAEGKDPNNVDKVYMIPHNGLFRWILYPHYLCEWIEWTGFWIVGGWDCFPARAFLINEVVAMFPRAISGKRWYVQRFGEEKVGNRKAIIPGII